MEKLQTELTEIGAKLADTSTYQDMDPDELQQILEHHGRLKNRLEAAEAEWFAVQEELEDARESA